MLLEDPMPAIQSYLAKGFKVFPVAAGDRCPLISKAIGGRGCHDATDNLDQISAWWHRWPRANWGIAAGEVSNLSIVDFDPVNGADVSVAKLAAQGKVFTPTLQALTASEGRHLYYRFAPGLKNWSSKLAPGIDIRTSGGFVVAPPSRAKSKIDGKLYPYAWIDPRTGEVRKDSRLNDGDVISPLPSWIIDALKPAQTYRAFQPIRPLTNERAQGRLGRQTDLIRAEREGNRNGALSSRAFYAWKNYVATGIASENALAAQLLAAGLSTGITRKESLETIQKAFEAAKRKAA